MTGKLTLGYRDAVAVTGSALAPAGSRARPRIPPHGHPRARRHCPRRHSLDRRGERVALAGQGGVVAEGFVQGGVHASYLHTHWNGLPAAAERIVAAARSPRALRDRQERARGRDSRA
jgi:cobyrinic acid a,c-diamide synthase